MVFKIISFNNVVDYVYATDVMKQVVADLTKRAMQSGKTVVRANIGDVTGISEVPLIKELRVELARKYVASSENKNGYRPYVGMDPLLAAISEDLSSKLSMTIDKNRVVLSSGTAALDPLIKIHSRYYHGSKNPMTVPIGLLSPTYWKHTDVSEESGHPYHFLNLVQKSEEGSSLSFNFEVLDSFCDKGGKILVLNFGNPLCFLPSEEETTQFVEKLRGRNVSVIIDGPYDGLYDDNRGYLFPKALLESPIATSYIHPRTKINFATGSRWGEVVGNNKSIIDKFKSIKGAQIGSDSSLEQDLLLEAMNSSELEGQLEEKYQEIKERKQFFWDSLTEKCSKIAEDSRPMYCEDGPFYVYLDVTSLLSGKQTSMDIANLCADQGVVALPGTLFGRDNELNRTCMRFALASLGVETWRSEITQMITVIASLRGIHPA